MIRTIVAVLSALVVTAYIVFTCAIGFGALVPAGANFAPKSGIVETVDPDSPASRAGVRPGDRLDLQRSSWAVHLALNRPYIWRGGHITYALLRGGKPMSVTLESPVNVPPPNAWANFVSVVFAVFYYGLGVLLFVLRRNTASLMFMLLACGQAIALDNLAFVRPFAPAWMPFAFVLASIGPALGALGMLYFATVFANTPERAALLRKFVLMPIVVSSVVTYYVHFYTQTIWPEPFRVYTLSTILNLLAYVVAAIAITARVRRDAVTAPGLRWVAAGIWLQNVLFAAFFIDQNLSPLSSGGNPVISFLNSWFQPGLLCIAYVLLRSRVIDVRVAGTRTLVYGLMTAIPIGLFSAADWFFSRKLADARLATFVEFGVAVVFGIWINTLHKRIDRFVERIVFAARYHGFTRVRNAVHALPAVERTATVYAMLTAECANALNLASAALFVEQNGIFERVAAVGWEGCARSLEPDDPIALFVRSSAHAVRVAEFAPSPSILPSGDAAPDLAIPLMVHHAVAAFVLYGRHITGEHVDATEEDLLSELTHAAGSALVRLRSADRIAELEARLTGAVPAF